MADKPSRALVVYGYGLADMITPSHTHIHTLASKGSCGFLALDFPSPPQDVEDEKQIRELAQLLDASEAQKQPSSMAERFMGMKAAMVTSNSSVKAFGEKLGFSCLEFEKLGDGQSSEVVSYELLKMLGFHDGKTLESDYFDLVFVHFGSLGKENRQNELESVNTLVGNLLKAAQPGSEIGSRLHLTLIMSYGTARENDSNLSLLSLKNENKPDLLSLFPRQSYALKGVDLRNDIRHHCPMLMAQLQDAVTRKDMADEFSFNELRERCGNLAIPADRFVHEVAFKLWKAPKYGA